MLRSNRFRNIFYFLLYIIASQKSNNYYGWTSNFPAIQTDLFPENQPTDSMFNTAFLKIMGVFLQSLMFRKSKQKAGYPYNQLSGFLSSWTSGCIDLRKDFLIFNQ